MSPPKTDDKHLLDARFVRWQGIAMAQFTIAIALLSALSISMLDASVAIISRPGLPAHHAHGLAIGLSMLLLTAVVFLCLLATVSRTLDFRLTARKVRGNQCPVMFGLDKDQFGRLTWLSFWTALLLFLMGGLLFIASATLCIAPMLLCGA